ncbi:drug/metabolite exporter YedA [Kitasatospora sp. NE20-6]|uniref:EamA family transporter n=1 Tax=Kitasatospora sp. NE20-6 TaxID=2859066 RepID=UPI0034DC05BC
MPGRSTAAPPRGRIALALLAVWVLWGSTFLGIRVVVQAVPPLLAAGVRFTLAGALLLAVLTWRWHVRGEPGPWVRMRGRTRRTALLGVLHFLCSNGLVSIASERLPSAAAGTYFATVPLWVLAVGAVSGRRGTRADLYAALLGLVGVATLLGFEPGALLPSLLVLLAALTWAVAGRLAAPPPAGGGADPAPAPGAALTSAVQMLTGGLALLVASAAAGEWPRLRPQALGAAVWLAEAHLVLLGSLVGFLAYTWLTARVDQRLTSTYSYVNPLVAVGLGVAVLGERIGPATVAGTAFLTVAVGWTVLGSARRTRAAAPAPAAPQPTPPVPSPSLPQRLPPLPLPVRSP